MMTLIVNLLLKTANALEKLALHLDPDAWTRDRVSEHISYMAHLEEQRWLREHEDEVELDLPF